MCKMARWQQDNKKIYIYIYVETYHHTNITFWTSFIGTLWNSIIMVWTWCMYTLKLFSFSYSPHRCVCVWEGMWHASNKSINVMHWKGQHFWNAKSTKIQYIHVSFCRWHLMSNINVEKQQMSLCAVLLLRKRYTTAVFALSRKCKEAPRSITNFHPIERHRDLQISHTARRSWPKRPKRIPELQITFRHSLGPHHLSAKFWYTFVHPTRDHSWNIRLKHVRRTPCQWVQDMLQ